MAAKSIDGKACCFPSFKIGKDTEGDVFKLSSHLRAREAIELSLSTNDSGFNAFVIGADRSGRMSATIPFLKDFVAGRPTPDDWIYLNNFRKPERPKPYRLSAGVGRTFRNRMNALLPQLRDALSTAFGSEEYEAEANKRRNQVGQEISKLVEVLREDAKQAGLTIIQTPQGMAVVALDAAGEPLAIESIPEDKRQALRDAGDRISEQLQGINREAARLKRVLEDELREFNRKIGDNAISGILDDLVGQFSDYPDLAQWLVEMRGDVLDNLDLFRVPPPDGLPPGTLPPEQRYAVNLLVDNGDSKGPAVLLEPNPSYENLFGQIEYRPVPGGIVETDLTLIRAGALHRANGGVLVLRAESLARHAYAWDLLKGALRDREIRIEELHRMGALPIAAAPKPEPIPLSVRVIIVGAPFWYHAYSYDPDLRTYFKIKADIDPDMDATPENLAGYVGLIRKMAANLDGATCEDDTLRLLLGLASRWAGNREKLSSQYENVQDMLAEAIQVNKQSGRRVVTKNDILAVIQRKRRRNARVEDRMQENIAKGLLMIDTAGEAVGQVNALSVLDLGDHAFGVPSRITARASAGRSGVINIEREVELGGPIQQKGAMVLQGYLTGRFAKQFPLSFNCSITFEQNYGGVEGDSASLAELLAILSDLSGVKLRQDLAITGSVNQHGFAQAIGGVHHKIEGFYRACVEGSGLTGNQGVVIPAANEPHLLLRDEVTEAIEKKKFHLWSVKTIEEAIELFTGVPAGTPDGKGNYPPDTVFGKVMTQLKAFDRTLSARAVGAANRDTQ
ncbi:MAG: AAA family ATPase [Alphaproteobacteria bacterium]|nr:AAA family ATPase [Alphaproteobacteria bacterium]